MPSAARQGNAAARVVSTSPIPNGAMNEVLGDAHVNLSNIEELVNVIQSKLGVPPASDAPGQPIGASLLAQVEDARRRTGNIYADLVTINSAL